MIIICIQGDPKTSFDNYLLMKTLFLNLIILFLMHGTRVFISKNGVNCHNLFLCPVPLFIVIIIKKRVAKIKNICPRFFIEHAAFLANF